MWLPVGIAYICYIRCTFVIEAVTPLLTFSRYIFIQLMLVIVSRYTFTLSKSTDHKRIHHLSPLSQQSTDNLLRAVNHGHYTRRDDCPQRLIAPTSLTWSDWSIFEQRVVHSIKKMNKDGFKEVTCGLDLSSLKNKKLFLIRHPKDVSVMQTRARYWVTISAMHKVYYLKLISFKCQLTSIILVIILHYLFAGQITLYYVFHCNVVGYGRIVQKSK